MNSVIIKANSSIITPAADNPYLPDIESALMLRVRCSDYAYANDAPISSIVAKQGSGDVRQKTFDRVNPAGATGWNPPVWKTNGPNGAPFLYADGGAGLANGLNELEINAQAQPTTIYVVARADSFPAGITNERVIAGLSSSNLHNVNIAALNSAGTVNLSAGNTIATNAAVQPGQWFVAIAVFNGASGKYKISGGAIVSANMGSHAYRGTSLFRNNAAKTGAGLVGGIAEFGVYSRALSDSDINGLYAEMSARYAI